MDKAKAYSILVTWVDFNDNPLRSKWCYHEMEKLLLQDIEETIPFIKVQKDHEYLDLLSQTFPELAYQFQSWDFIKEMEDLSQYHNTEIWLDNIEHAKKKIKKPQPQS